jgi:beta-galactosidase
MQKYPPLADPHGGPDPRAYNGLVDPFYRGAFDARVPVRLVHADQLGDVTPETHPVLVVSGLYLAADDTLDGLRAYAEGGGHLVVGPRTGYADPEGRARTDRMPARLAEATGVWYDEYSNLTDDLPVTATADGLPLNDLARATRWVDGLVVEDATVLAEYDHPHFGQWPAVTTKAVGEGRITYVGTVPNLDLARALLTWLVPNRGDGWRALPPSVTASGATAPDGRRVRFVHNWSFTSTTVRLPVAVADALGDDRFEAGTELPLGPWDVRVLIETALPGR